MKIKIVKKDNVTKKRYNKLRFLCTYLKAPNHNDSSNGRGMEKERKGKGEEAKGEKEIRARPDSATTSILQSTPDNSNLQGK